MYNKKDVPRKLLPKEKDMVISVGNKDKWRIICSCNPTISVLSQHMAVLSKIIGLYTSNYEHNLFLYFQCRCRRHIKKIASAKISELLDGIWPLTSEPPPPSFLVATSISSRDNSNRARSQNSKNIILWKLIPLKLLETI